MSTGHAHIRRLCKWLHYAILIRNRLRLVKSSAHLSRLFRNAEHFLGAIYVYAAFHTINTKQCFVAQILIDIGMHYLAMSPYVVH